MANLLNGLRITQHVHNMGAGSPQRSRSSFLLNSTVTIQKLLRRPEGGLRHFLRAIHQSKANAELFVQ